MALIRMALERAWGRHAARHTFRYTAGIATKIATVRHTASEPPAARPKCTSPVCKSEPRRHRRRKNGVSNIYALIGMEPQKLAQKRKSRLKMRTTHSSRPHRLFKNVRLQRRREALVGSASQAASNAKPSHPAWRQRLAEGFSCGTDKRRAHLGAAWISRASALP